MLMLETMDVGRYYVCYTFDKIWNRGRLQSGITQRLPFILGLLSRGIFFNYHTGETVSIS